MSVTETSKSSYRKIGDLGTRQREVHNAIKELGIASNREIAKYLRMETNAITGRTKELRDLGFVAEHGKKYDQETNRNVTAWCVTDPNDKKLIDIFKRIDDDTDKFGHSFGVANG